MKKLRQADGALSHILFLQVNKLGNVLMGSDILLSHAGCCAVCSSLSCFIFVIILLFDHFSQKSLFEAEHEPKQTVCVLSSG